MASSAFTDFAFPLVIGDDNAIVITFATGIDISAYAFKMEIRLSDDGTLIKTYTNGSGITVSGQVATIAITHADSALLANGKTYYSDIRVVRGNGTIYHIPRRLVHLAANPVTT